MDNIDTYIKRKEEKELVNYIHPSLEPILKSTYGIIIYQEQIMQIASVMAGYSYGEADVLRRAMSKKDEDKLSKERPKFIKGAINKGYDEKLANHVFDLILKFADYGFNKSHSVAYAIIGYKMAFLKTYFLKYFLSASLSNVIGNEYKTKIYITEARNNRITILNPDINLSEYKYVNEENGIRCPLSIIRNVGKAGYSEIEKERKNGLFTSFIDFVVRCYSQSLNKKALTYLIYAGCFDTFGYNKKTLINNLDNVINYAELAKDSGMIEFEKPYIEEEEEYSKEKLIDLEIDTYGFYLTSHPTLVYKSNDDIDLINISNYFNKRVSSVVLVEKTKEVVTKKNDIMLFITGSDNTDNVDIVLFPKIYEKYKNINKGNIIRIASVVEKRFDKYQLVVNDVRILE